MKEGKINQLIILEVLPDFYHRKTTEPRQGKPAASVRMCSDPGKRNTLRS